MPLLPSLHLLSDVTSDELTAHERRVAGLDSKAGVLLGFSGVLVALSSSNLVGPLAYASATLAGIAAIMAGLAFVPRRFPAVDLLNLRNYYLTAQEDYTRLRLLDTRIAMAQEVKESLKWKARFVTSAAYSLGVAVALAVIAFTLG